MRVRPRHPPLGRRYGPYSSFSASWRNSSGTERDIPSASDRSRRPPIQNDLESCRWRHPPPSEPCPVLYLADACHLRPRTKAPAAEPETSAASTPRSPAARCSSPRSVRPAPLAQAPRRPPRALVTGPTPHISSTGSVPGPAMRRSCLRNCRSRPTKTMALVFRPTRRYRAWPPSAVAVKRDPSNAHSARMRATSGAIMSAVSSAPSPGTKRDTPSKFVQNWLLVVPSHQPHGPVGQLLVLGRKRSCSGPRPLIAAVLWRPRVAAAWPQPRRATGEPPMPPCALG